jgi:hypothetical protein
MLAMIVLSRPPDNRSALALFLCTAFTSLCTSSEQESKVSSDVRMCVCKKRGMGPYSALWPSADGASQNSVSTPLSDLGWINVIRLP